MINFNKASDPIWIIMIIALLIIPLVSAEVKTLGTAKQNDCINLPQTYWNSTFTNITQIQYPNKSIASVNYGMTSDSKGNYNYTYCGTADLGQYIITTCTDVDGIITCVGYDFNITESGKADASGIIIVLFSIFFLISIILTGFMTLYAIGHLLSLDFDIVDLSIDWGIYFGIIALYYLETFYLGNALMDNWLLLLIKIGAVVLILLPIVAFILSITMGTLKNKALPNQQPIQKFRWRRK